MTERENIDPYLLSSEYWDGHKPEDCYCERHISPPLPLSAELNDAWAMYKPKRFANKVLTDFLTNLEEDRTPLRVFKKGETFDASEFPPGTVIGFTKEHKDILRKVPYYNKGGRWGVVCDYKQYGEFKRDIIIYDASSIDLNNLNGSPLFLGPGRLAKQTPQITIGEVMHGIGSFMYRISTLAVYEPEKGVKQEERKRSLIWGVLFPKPRPESV